MADPSPPPRMRQYLSDALVFGVTFLIARSVGVVLVPMYAERLTKAEFGLLAVWDVVLWLFLMVGEGGIGEAYGYWAVRQGEDERRVLGSGYVVAAALSGLVALGLVLARLPLATRFLGGPQNAPIVSLVAWTGFFSSLHYVTSAVLPFARRRRLFLIIMAAETVLRVGLAVLFVGVLGWGLWGALLGYLIPFALLAVYEFAVLYAATLPLVRYDTVLRMARYGMSLIPGQLAAGAELNIGRLVLGRYRPLDELGGYAMGCKISTLSQLAISPLRTVLRPNLYRLDPTDRRSFARLTSFMALVTYSGVMVVALLTPELVRVFGRGRYPESVVLAQWVLVGTAWRAGFSFLGFGPPLKGRPAVASAIGAWGGLLNVGLCLWWIPRWGAYGAAYANAASAGAMALVGALATRHAMGFGQPLAEALSLVVGVLLIGFAASRIDHAPLPVRLGLLVLPALTLAVLGVHLWRQRRRGSPASEPESEALPVPADDLGADALL